MTTRGHALPELHVVPAEQILHRKQSLIYVLILFVDISGDLSHKRKWKLVFSAGLL